MQPKHRKVSAMKERTQSTHSKARNFYETRLISISAIKLPEPAKPTDKHVSRLAESMRVHGFFGAILVAPLKKEGDEGEQFVLVAGADRLAAAKLLGVEKVPCTIIETPALDEAEMRCEWLQHAAAQIAISRQHVQKFRGRPKAAITYAVEHFPYFGRSLDARKKEAQRAQKINSLPADVKAAAREAKLDSSQSALLDVAGVGGTNAQLRRIKELAESRTAQDSGTEKPKNAKKQSKATTRRDVKQSIASTETTDEKPDEKPKLTTLLELKTAWDRDCKELYKNAQLDVRGEFLKYLKKNERTCRDDLETLIKKAFLGRRVLAKRDLSALAESFGLSGKAVLQVANELKYASKRVGNRRSGASYDAFINSDTHYNDYVVEISDEQIVQAVAQHLAKDKRETSSAGYGIDDEYFNMEDDDD
jgi:ParB/Sulfiredoxin domain